MKLVIINGLPATGKTTLAHQLKDALNLQIVAKDDIKEFLFNTIGHNDREWSKKLGRISIEFLYKLCDELLASDTSFIVEAAFEYEFAHKQLGQLIEIYKPEVVELYCTVPPTVRKKRFIERNESGNRHPGHFDQANYTTDDVPEPYEKYRPLELSKVVHIDTDKAYSINEIIKLL